MLISFSGANTKGNLTIKQLPLPKVLSTETSPPCISTSSRTSDKPTPVLDASFQRERLPRLKRSKIWGKSFLCMPSPSSETEISSCFCACPTSSFSTIRWPDSVCLKALDKRLKTIFSSDLKSSITGRSGAW